MLLSFWACRRALPNPDTYRACILDSYNELRDATLGTESSEASDETTEPED